ncbi:MAG: ATP-binding cassette domain-containing protein [Bacteroidia bacterium]|nr:ATP-binding cassette domain-containing protein [Bacteroidia bacterium]
MRVTAEKLGKRYNREWVFRNFDFTFEQGNTYAITGPNGSGKSTLLQVLWGQLPQSTGLMKYEMNGREISITEIFQHLSIATPYMELIDEFTLVEMVEFHFKFKKIRGGRTIEELLNLMELSHARAKHISNFSSGMKQRLKLALAFYSDTPLIFLDEPSTNLDKKSTEWYMKNLLGLPNECAVFIASNQEHEYPANSVKIDIMRFK